METVEVNYDSNAVAETPTVEFRSKEGDTTPQSGYRASLISADSAMPPAAINPDTFFINKFPVEQLSDEITQFAKTVEDQSALTHLWILKQIDHWNNDHEMVVGLTSNGVYMMKFDFVTRKRRGDIQSVRLSEITSLARGQITYPQYSVMERHDLSALRINWGDLNAVSLTERWNPVCRTIPSCVFASHPLLLVENKDCDNTSRARFDIDHFAGALLQAVQGHKPTMQLEETPILINSYFSLSSLVFNQSQLGFSKDRNGVSF